MSATTYFIIGAAIVVAVIIAALMRANAARKSKRPSDDIAEPIDEPVTVPAAHITPEMSISNITLDPEPAASPPLSETSANVEVWNQTDFQVFVTQQGIRATLPAQGRAQMDSRFPLTVIPATSDNTWHSVSLQGTGTGGERQCLIVHSLEK
ncbi:hypothetical protein F0169_15825 [Pseudomonas sp. MAFF 212408]|uniref:Uncharacterized protein n=1 Tax=Pseudomonas kitaguniensis TaxID=2607908 RepID=A0A5N7KMY7_9PSED|nr:hypothetical protein [Pseudomonas kitaguniensis]MPR03410.1 hypothetical protein [Pseudomonas kitaguniensis]